MRGVAAALVIVGSAVWAGPARAARWEGPAGEPTEAELARAREFYARGSEQVEGHRWSDALESFERSYALSGASVALYSIAYTLRVIGRYRESRDAFDQLLREHHDLEPGIRREAERLRREVVARIAVLNLTGIPEDVTPTVLLDGEEVADDGRRPLPVEADPGERVVRVEAPGYEVFVWRADVAPGARLTVPVDLESLSTPVTDSAVFWVAVGASVLAAGVVIGLVLYEGAQLDPRTSHHVTL